MIETTADATLIADLAGLVSAPPGGILSRTIYADQRARVVLFAFDAGQELSEHTSAHAAIIQIISGAAQLTIGAAQLAGRPGTWAHMAPRTPHAIVAETPLVLVLTLLLDPR